MLTTAEKALLYVDGSPLVAGTAGIFTSDAAVAIPQNQNTEDGLLVFIVAQGEGEATITVDKDGRSGTGTLVVTEAPLIITFGDPEPK